MRIKKERKKRKDNNLSKSKKKKIKWNVICGMNGPSHFTWGMNAPRLMPFFIEEKYNLIQDSGRKTHVV